MITSTNSYSRTSYPLLSVSNVNGVSNAMPYAMNGTYAEVAWPAADLILYIPVIVSSRVTARKVWFGGGGVGGGNYDQGIYTKAGERLVSTGAQAKGTGATPNTTDITDTILEPGFYYIALTDTTNTDTYTRCAVVAPNYAISGMLTQAGPGGLPSTATFARDVTLAYLPPVGIIVDGIR